MRRLIYLSTLFLFIVVSCDSPVSNTNQQSPQSIQLDVVIPSAPFSVERIQPDTARKAAWQQFKQQNGDQWRVRWNPHTGLPASVFSGLSKKAYRKEPEQAARSFLAVNAGLFGLANLENLNHVKTQTHRGIRHVTFNQVVDGVPVYEAQYKVHLRRDGRVDMVNGSFYPNIKVTTPAVAKSQATSTAKSDLNSKNSQVEVDATKVIYRMGEEFLLAWKLILFSSDPLVDWLYFVGAHSGEVRYKLDRLADVTGDGDVYPTHPGLSSVTNKPLYRLIGNGRLQGTYANVVNDVGAEAYSSTHSFQYSTSNTHFDEVNLYYYIDDFRQNFIEGVDNGSLGLNQITAHAHSNNSPGPNNAWFSPSTGDIYFGDGTGMGFNSFAREDKIIHYEYGHAVIYDIQSGIQSSSNEEGGISEGTPDYFTGSFTGRSQILEWATPNYDRDMANPEIVHYDDLSTDPQTGEVNEEAHDGGEFFSSVLWDLRNSSVGASVTDFLVYDALYRITNGPDFLEFRDAMIAADDAAYGGNHETEIYNTFADAGIVAPLSVIVNGPGHVPPGSTWFGCASVSGGFPPYSYQWYQDGGPVGPDDDCYSFQTSSSDEGSSYQISVTVTDDENNQASDQTSFIVFDHH